MNYLAQMLEKDLNRYRLVYQQVPDLDLYAPRFEKVYRSLFKPKRKIIRRVFGKKEVPAIDVDKLVHLLDVVLSYQNTNYLKYQRFYDDLDLSQPERKYPYLFEWTPSEEEDAPTLSLWKKKMIESLNRHRNADLKEHEMDGIYALTCFLSILKTYEISMEELYKAWESKQNA